METLSIFGRIPSLRTMFLLRRTALRALSAAPFAQAVPSRTFHSAIPALQKLRKPVIASVQQRRLYSDEPVREQTASSSETSAPAEEEARTTDEVPKAQADAIDTASTAGSTTTSSSKAPSSMTSVYVGNLFFEVTEEQLERLFTPFGPLTDITLVSDNRGLSRGFGFIRFERAEDAEAACSSLNQQVFEGRRIVVAQQNSKPIPSRSTRDREAKEPTKTLFIGNMSFEMSDKDLNDLFRDIRNVVDVRVAIDRRTGQPRGFAHADFVDIESAKQAVETLQGKVLYGRELRLDYSNPSADRR